MTDYLAMAKFLKPRGYSIIDNVVTFPGSLSAVCADMNDAYQMAFGHFLAGELGRKWGDMWYSDFQKDFVFSPDELEAIETAIRHYESLEAQE